MQSRLSSPRCPGGWPASSWRSEPENAGKSSPPPELEDSSGASSFKVCFSSFIGGSDAEVAINEAVRRGFTGSIWPVNPTRSYMAGYKCYKSVLDLPFGPDAVFMAIPAKMILTCQKADADPVCGALIGEFRSVLKEGFWDYKIHIVF